MSIIQCQFYESESARAESDYDSLTMGSKYVQLHNHGGLRRENANELFNKLINWASVLTES